MACKVCCPFSDNCWWEVNNAGLSGANWTEIKQSMWVKNPRKKQDRSCFEKSGHSVTSDGFSGRERNAHTHTHTHTHTLRWITYGEALGPRQTIPERVNGGQLADTDFSPWSGQLQPDCRHDMHFSAGAPPRTPPHPGRRSVSAESDPCIKAAACMDRCTVPWKN